jgi:hypothetical protein
MATYYVDTASTGGNGTTQATSGANAAFATVAAVNAGSFSPGDSILFKKGCVWREQLTVPSSGSSGNPITFGAYGSGADPIISASDLKDSGYSEYSSTIDGSVTQANLWLSLVDGAAFVDFSNTDSAALTSNLGALITISDHIGGAGHRISGYIKAAGTGSTPNRSGSEKFTNTDFANTTGITTSNASIASVAGGQSGNCLEVTNSASNGFAQEVITTATVGALYKLSIYAKKGTGTYISIGIQEQASPYILYATTGSFAAPADWTQYSLHAIAINVNIKGTFTNGSASTTTQLFDTASLQQVVSPSQYGVTITTTSGGSTYNWDMSDAGSFDWNDTAGYSYSIQAVSDVIWQIALTTEPKVVYFDGVLGTHVASADECNGSGKWYWVSDVFYVYSASDPATAFTNPGVEAGTRNSAIHTNNKIYLTFDELILRDGNNVNDSVVHVGSVTVTGFIIQNCTIERGRGAGINLLGSSTATSATIDACTIRDNAGFGILSDYVYTTATVSNSTFTGNGWAALIDSIYYADIISKLDNFNIFGNDFSNVAPNGSTDPTGNHCHNIYAEATTATIEIYDNVFHDNLYGDGVKTQASANIYRNRFYGNSGSGIEIGTNGAINVGVLAYCNIFYGNCTNNNQGAIEESNKGAGTLSLTAYNNSFYKNGTYADINIQENITALILKNNCVYSNTAAYAYRSPTQSAATINNNCIYGPSGNPVYYNGASRSWATWQGLGFDMAGINTDPLFVSPTDFHLQAGSPCINAGVDVGLITDYSGDDLFRLPDIGALEVLKVSRPSNFIRALKVGNGMSRSEQAS